MLIYLLGFYAWNKLPMAELGFFPRSGKKTEQRVRNRTGQQLETISFPCTEETENAYIP